MRLVLIAVSVLILSACSEPAPQALTDPSAETASASSSSASQAPLHFTAATTMPEAFHGLWDGDNASCATSGSDMRLTITASKLTFWESEALVKSVSPHGPNAILLKASFSGEGETWERELILTLSDDGKTLITDRDLTFARVRCG